MKTIIDRYPTRIFKTSGIIERKSKVSYFQDLYLSQYQFDFYNKNGYLILKGFFDRKKIDKLYENINNLNSFETIEPNGSNQKRAVSFIHEHELVKNVFENKWLIDIVKNILGSQIYVHQSRINFKKSLVGTGWYWHSDFETWHAQDGMPDMRCLSAMIPLTKNTECNGSLMVLPKSHLYFWSSKKSEKEYSPEENYSDQKEGVPDNDSILEFFKLTNSDVKMIKCNPTDLVLFDCNLMHVSTQNLSKSDRTNLFIVFNSIENKLQDAFSYNFNRPNELGNREINKIY